MENQRRSLVYPVSPVMAQQKNGWMFIMILVGLWLTACQTEGAVDLARLGHLKPALAVKIQLELHRGASPSF